MRVLEVLLFLAVISKQDAFVVRPLFPSSYSIVADGPRHHDVTLATATAEEVDTAGTDNTDEIPSPPLVQRKFETYLWKDEYKINYRVEGEGPPILLIHGFGGTVNHYRYQFPALVEAGYKVHAIDLLGFGASDKPGDVGYSIELFVELCVDFIRTQSGSNNMNNGEPEPWVVAGNSIGGLITLGVSKELQKVAQKDADEEENGSLIKAAVLFNCAGGMSGFRYEDVPMFIKPILWFVQNVVLGPQVGGSFFNNFKSRENVEAILSQQGVYRNTTNVDDYLLELLLEPGDDKGAKEVFLKTFGGPPGPTPESILPELEIPILALWGGEDPWVPVDRGMHPGTDFPNYAAGPFELQVLEGVGHCPHDESPNEINKRMIKWLASLHDV